MMPPDVISHENQLQHLSEPSIFMLDVFRTADHAGQIFIPHRHINRLCRSCYYQLRQLRVVSRSLSPPAASTLVLASVVSRLNYCSAVYEGLPICRLKCLDRILQRQPVLWAAFLSLDGSLRICGMSSTGSPTRNARYPQRIVYHVAALVQCCMEGLAHAISGNSVATLLLLSVVSHCAHLARRSY